MPVTLQEEHLGTLSSLASSITLPATYTINIWVKNANLDSSQQWANLYWQSGNNYLLDAHYGQIGAGNWTNNSTPDAARLSYAAADPLRVADTWHLVTLVYDGATMEYFANGVSMGTVDPNANATLATAIDTLNGPAPAFAAEVKDLRVYEGVATSQQIADSYNNNGEIQGENNMYNYFMIGYTQGPTHHNAEGEGFVGLKNLDLVNMTIDAVKISLVGLPEPFIDWDDQSVGDPSMPFYAASAAGLNEYSNVTVELLDAADQAEGPVLGWATHKLVISDTVDGIAWSAKVYVRFEDTGVVGEEPHIADLCVRVFDAAGTTQTGEWNSNQYAVSFLDNLSISPGTPFAQINDALLLEGSVILNGLDDTDLTAIASGIYPQASWNHLSTSTHGDMSLSGTTIEGLEIYHTVDQSSGAATMKAWLRCSNPNKDDKQQALYDILLAAKNDGNVLQPLFYRDTNPIFGENMAAVADGMLIAYVHLEDGYVYASGDDWVKVVFAVPDGSGGLDWNPTDLHLGNIQAADANYDNGMILGVTSQAYNPTDWDGGDTGIPTGAAATPSKRLVVKLTSLVNDAFASELRADIVDSGMNVLHTSNHALVAQGAPIEFVFGTSASPTPDLSTVDFANGHKVLIRDTYGDGIGELVDDGTGFIELYLRDESDVDSAKLAEVAVSTVAAAYLDSDGKPGVYFDWEIASEVMTVGVLQSDEVALAGAGGGAGGGGGVVSVTPTRIDADKQVDFQWDDGAGNAYETVEEMVADGALYAGTYSSTAFDPRMLKFQMSHAEVAASPGTTIANKAYVDQEISDAALEIDHLEGAVGMSGSYAVHAAANYISAATSLHNADLLLDSAVFALSGAVAGDLADVRSEFAAADTALHGVISAEIDGDIATQEALSLIDRNAVRSEFAAADTALSGAVAGDFADVRSEFAAADAAIQADVDANETMLLGAISALSSSMASSDASLDADIQALSSSAATDRASIRSEMAVEIADLIDSAPGALDTLNELAAAIGDDPNFATSITNVVNGFSGSAASDRAAIRSEFAAADVGLVGGASAAYNTLKKIEDKMIIDAQDLVDYETSNNAALTAEITRATGVENAIQADVDANETMLLNAISALSSSMASSDASLDADIQALSSSAGADRAAIRSEFASEDAIIQAELTAHKSAYDAKMILLDDEDALIRVDFAAADTALSGAVAGDLADVRSEFASEDAIIQAELTAHKTAYDAKMILLDAEDALIRVDFAAADSALSGAVAGDFADVRSEFAAADTIIQTELTNHKSAYDAKMILLDDEDALIRVDFAAADVVLHDLIDGGASAAYDTLKKIEDKMIIDAQDLVDYETSNDAAVSALSSSMAASDASLSADIQALSSSAEADRADIRSEMAAEIADLIDSAPGALDTLNELAAAIGDDPNFAVSITNVVNGFSGSAASDRALIRSEFAAEDAIIQAELTAHKTAYNAKMILLDQEDALIRVDFAAADTALSGAVAGDFADVRSEFAAADTALSGAVEGDFADVRSEFAAADSTLSGAIYNRIDLLQGDIDGNEEQHDLEMSEMFGSTYVSGGVSGGIFSAYAEDQLWPLQSSDLHSATDMGDALKKVEERLQESEYGLKVTFRAASDMMVDLETLESEVVQLKNDVQTEIQDLATATAGIHTSLRTDVAALVDMTCQETTVLSSAIVAGGALALGYNASKVHLVSLNGQILTVDYDYTFDSVSAAGEIGFTFGCDDGDRLVVVYQKALVASSNVLAPAGFVVPTVISDPTNFDTKVQDEVDGIVAEESWGAPVPSFPLD